MLYLVRPNGTVRWSDLFVGILADPGQRGHSGPRGCTGNFLLEVLT